MEDHIRKFNKNYKNHNDEPIKTEDTEDYTKMNIDGTEIINEEGLRRFPDRISSSSKILSSAVNPFNDSPYMVKVLFFCLAIATSLVLIVAIASMIIKK